MEPVVLSEGLVVADRRLRVLLGSGGEGQVWEAEHPDGGVVALKLVRPDVLPSPAEVRRRGQWLVRIDHPALVRVSRGGRFTTGPLQGWGFVEMALVDGPSLQTAQPDPDALSRLAGVAEALDLLHAGAWSDGVPLIHRDVKPGNLIDTGNGLVLVDPSTMRGLDTTDLTRVGTPAYLAPEVVTGRFGPLVDVYSLAATAVALTTGHRGAALLAAITDPGGLPLPDGVRAALDPDPARRPGTCAAVVSTTPPVQVQVGLRPRRRHTRWPYWALVLLSVTPAAVWGTTRGIDPWVPADVVQGVVLGALAGQLAVHTVTGRAAAGLLVPPWAWADLIDAREPDLRSRSSWRADSIAGVIVLSMAGAVLSQFQDMSPLGVPGAVVTGLIAIRLLLAASRVSSRAVWTFAWLLSTPLRILGGLPRVLVTGGR